jgi:hypothetical protein
VRSFWNACSSTLRWNESSWLIEVVCLEVACCNTPQRVAILSARGGRFWRVAILSARGGRFCIAANNIATAMRGAGQQEI